VLVAIAVVVVAAAVAVVGFVGTGEFAPVSSGSSVFRSLASGCSGFAGCWRAVVFVGAAFVATIVSAVGS